MSDALNGYEVVDLPYRKVSRAKMAGAVIAFMESGNEAMGKRYDDLRELQLDLGSARSFVRSHGIDVRVSKRGDMLILMRGSE